MKSTAKQQIFTEITTEQAAAINGGGFNPKQFVKGLAQVGSGIKNIWNSFWA